MKKISKSLSGYLLRISEAFLFLLFILILSFPAFTQSNKYLVKNFGTEHGLTHPTIKCIARDSTGFLWIGTFDGLSRFDGNDFVTYRHAPDDSASLPSNELQKILVDKFNTIWVISSHIARYDRSSERFISCFKTEKRFPDTASVLDISADYKGNIWVLRSDGLLRCNNRNNSFIPVKLKNQQGTKVRPPRQSFISIDGDGAIWIISPSRLDCYKNSEADQAEYVHSGQYRLNKDFFSLGLRIQPKLQIIKSRKESFLVSNFGIFKLDKERMEFISIHAKEGDFSGCRSFITCDEEMGIHVYDATKKSIAKISEQGALQMEASFWDGDGSIWVSGLDKNRNWIGLRHMIPLTNTFHHYFDKFNEEPTAIFAICQDDDQGFWIGARSKEYIFKLDKNGYCNSTVCFKKKIDAVQSRSQLSDPYVRAIHKDRLGNLWFGFLRDYLFYIDRLRHEFNQFVPEKQRNSILGDKTMNRQIITLKNGMLLIGGDNCMFIVNPENLAIVKTYFFASTNGGLYALFEDEQGSIWTGNGVSILRKFDQDLNPIDSVRLNTDFYNLEGITGNADTLWIASMGGGLIRYLTATGAIKFYTTRHGLSHNYTYHLFFDAQQNIWISTNEGLSVFNPKTEIFMNYSENDGLRIKEFNADAGFKAEDGRLFFGGMGGFVGFYPDSVYKMRRTSTGRLLFTNFSVSGIKRVFPKPIYEMDTIVLTKGDNNFQVTFAALDFNFPEKINYRYKLERVDDKWNLTSSGNRHANYAGILPGRYRFLVETANESGNWSGQKALVITIPAYVYQTVGFKISIVLLVLFIITLFLWMKYKQIRLDNLRKQESLRMKALQSQLNPHFIFNALNSVSYLITHKPKEIADQFVADFASLMRSFLNNSSKDYILLSEEIESVKTYLELEHLRLSERFDYQVEFPEDLETEAIEVVPSLVQPFVENAIWHGVGLLKERKGTIVVRFEQSLPKQITCTVEDNGVGRETAGMLKSPDYKKRQSKGVSLVHDRLDIINSIYKTDHLIITEDLFPGTEEPGTKVTIPIPVRVPDHKTKQL